MTRYQPAICSGDHITRLHGRVMLCLFCFGLVVASPVWAQRDAEYGRARGAEQREQRTDIGSARAAQIAESRYGGKALKVSRDGERYSIRLLLPSGTIKTVSISAAGE